jgi:hypothetical protein
MRDLGGEGCSREGANMKTRLFLALGLMLGLAACAESSQDAASAAGRGGSGSALAGGVGPGGVGQSPLGGNFRPGSQEELAATIGDRVLFATDSSQVGGDQRPILQRQAEWLNRYRQVQVTVEGHADERGTREYNLALASAAPSRRATCWCRPASRPRASRPSPTARTARRSSAPTRLPGHRTGGR